MKLQGSTWRGIALVGSAAAAAFGYGELFSVDISEQGLEFGGVLGVAVPAIVGIYEWVRDERKSAHKLVTEDNLKNGISIN